MGPARGDSAKALTVRQAARISAIEGKDLLRMGDRAMVTFEWCHRPEFLCEGTRIIFREGRTKGVGVIRTICADVPRTPPRTYKTTHIATVESAHVAEAR